MSLIVAIGLMAALVVVHLPGLSTRTARYYGKLGPKDLPEILILLTI